jgi:hypothetical protein
MTSRKSVPMADHGLGESERPEMPADCAFASRNVMVAFEDALQTGDHGDGNGRLAED